MASNSGPAVALPRTVLGVVETLVGLSGAVLVVGYIAGRLYFESYAGTFGLQLSDLGLSVQDTTFGALEFLVFPTFPTVLMAIMMGITDLAPPRVTGAILSRSNRKLSVIRAAIWVCFLALEGATFLTSVYVSHRGRWSTYAVASSLRLPLFIGIGVAGMALVILASRSRTARRRLLAVVLLVGILLYGFPTFLGKLDGLVESTKPEGGVLVVAKESAGEGWIKDESGLWISPRLTLVGTTGIFLSLWDPDKERPIRIAISEIVAVRHLD